MSRRIVPIAIAVSMLAASSVAGGGLRDELRATGYRIVHESRRNGNWELILRNADGSEPVNLTNTPHVDELYPKASPDGRTIAFVAIEGAGRSRARNVYVMPLDGDERILAGPHGRQPFWTPTGDAVAFAMGNRRVAPEGGYANQGLYYYRLETRALSESPRRDVKGLLAPGFTPDGVWVVTSIIEGFGLYHAIGAFQPHGKGVVPLALAHSEHGRQLRNIYQCRPDVSPDGTRIAWGKDDIDNRLGLGRNSMYIEVAHVDATDADIRIRGYSYPVKARYPNQTYFVDWSPKGLYLAFSQGPRGRGRMAGTRHVVGREAPGWDIRVVRADPPHDVLQITHDGLSNKEPDWVPPPRKARDAAQ